jgi:Pyridoxamine 5'-phosphate oxidase like
MRVWFPKGPSDPDLALVRVRAREATYWISPSSSFVYAYGYAKALATGESPRPGDVVHVEMGGRR